MNTNDIATKEDISRLQGMIAELLDAITKLNLMGKNTQEEIYLTSVEVMRTYNLSKSHLSDLRNEGKIPFAKPFGIILYPKSEIEKIIKNNSSFPDKSTM